MPVPAPLMAPFVALALLGQTNEAAPKLPLQPIIGPIADKPLDNSTQARFDACLEMAIDDPASGIVVASEWLIDGGTYFARHCLAFAYSRDGRWQNAADSFAEAARDAQLAKDGRALNLWIQAGNAALAGGDANRALTFIDAALAQGRASGQALGELHLDRARALVALGEVRAADEEFDEVHKLVPEDPLGWLLSATLARRQGRLERAQADIDVAARLAGRDPAIGLEAGNIAVLAGRYDVARRNWEQAIAINPDGAEASAAKAQLAELDRIEAEQP